MRYSITLLILVAAVIYGIYFSYIKKEDSINFTNTDVTIIGTIDDYEEERISSNRYRVKIESYNGYVLEETARILVVTNPYTKHSYGQQISLIGVVEYPEDFITDTGKTFDYDSYLKLSKIYGIMRKPEIQVLDDFNGSHIKRILFNTRRLFAKKLDSRLNVSNSALTRGILLGEKTGITNDFRTSLAQTSTSHIIALSGYNITIVSELLMKISSSLSIVLRSVFGIGGIVLFIMLTSGGSSVVRAGIMAGILIYARSRGRTYKALHGLSWACALIIFVSPLSLRYDVGFHLSILATFGLIVFQNRIMVFFIKRNFYKWFSEILASTISATIMTMPYIAYSMGIVSVVGFFANIIVVPLIPLLMLSGFITGIMPWPLSTPFIFVTEKISQMIISTIEISGSFSFSAIYVESISLVWILGIYAVLFYYAFRETTKSS